MQARIHAVASRCLHFVFAALIRDPAEHDFLRQKTPRIISLLLSIRKNPSYPASLRDDVAYTLVSLLITLIDGTSLQSDRD